MDKNPSRPIAVMMIAMLGFVIFKHFDFSTLTFKDPWLDALYIVILVVLLFLLFRERVKRKRENQM